MRYRLSEEQYDELCSTLRRSDAHNTALMLSDAWNIPAALILATIYDLDEQSSTFCPAKRLKVERAVCVEDTGELEREEAESIQKCKELEDKMRKTQNTWPKQKPHLLHLKNLHILAAALLHGTTDEVDIQGAVFRKLASSVEEYIKLVILESGLLFKEHNRQQDGSRKRGTISGEWIEKAVDSIGGLMKISETAARCIDEAFSPVEQFREPES